MTEKQLFEGVCVGGPLDGRDGQSRFPRGFVLIDKPGQRAWIYDRQGDGECAPFYVREADGRSLDDTLRWAAAESSDWDVRVLDDVNDGK